MYTDETWVNAGHTKDKQWHPPDKRRDRGLPHNRGECLIILHAGCKEHGFLNNCQLVFQSKSKDNRDYHTEMNGKVFLKWVTKQLIPNLPQNSDLVMDNAPYHNLRTVESTSPTSAWRKADIKDWLDTRNIAYPPNALKPQLYDIVKLNKPPIEHEADRLIRAAGHETLRLPAYHCSLNPIELIWGNLKNRIAMDNSTFKLNDVRDMINDGFTRIDQQAWSHAVRHVVDVVEVKYWTDDGLLNVEPVIIHLGSDDDTDSDDDD